MLRAALTHQDNAARYNNRYKPNVQKTQNGS
jgi:hypothetical protein